MYELNQLFVAKFEREVENKNFFVIPQTLRVYFKWYYPVLEEIIS